MDDSVIPQVAEVEAPPDCGSVACETAAESVVKAVTEAPAAEPVEELAPT